jgi:predicted nucleic acid-binding protein
MLDQFFDMRNIVRHRAKPYLRRVLELAHNFTAYDALYVALAEKMRVPLLTRDAKYWRAPVHDADLQVYP